MLFRSNDVNVCSQDEGESSAELMIMKRERNKIYIMLTNNRKYLALISRLTSDDYTNLDLYLDGENNEFLSIG